VTTSGVRKHEVVNVTPPQDDKVMPKGCKQVLILGPGISQEDCKEYKRTFSSDVYIIGDSINPVDENHIQFQSLNEREKETRVDVRAHGGVIDAQHHSEVFSTVKKGPPSLTLTKNLLNAFKDTNPEVPLYIHSWSCFSGAANRDAEILPPGSVLITHASADHIAHSDLAHEGITKSLSRRITSAESSREEFIRNMDLAIDPAHYTEVLANGQLMHFSLSGLEDIIKSQTSGEYAEKCVEKFNVELRRNGFTEVKFLPEVPEDLRAKCFIYRAHLYPEEIKQYTKADLESLVNSKLPDGNTALHIIAQYGNADASAAVQSLIERGADPDLRNSESKAPLHLAIDLGNMEAANKLIEAGANLDARELTHEDTFLHIAVREGNIPLLKKLIEAGADINASDKDKHTPLHLAVAKGNEEMVKVLVEAGANIYAKDIKGKTPTSIASRRNDTKILASLVETVQPRELEVFDRAFPQDRNLVRLITTLTDRANECRSSSFAPSRTPVGVVRKRDISAKKDK
jgi:hypothetical protein